MNDDTISRQAAIDALCNDYCGGHQDCKYYPKCENLKSIQKLPSVERREVQSSECEYWDDESNFCTLYRPSAERRGRWVDVEPAPHNLFYATCSVCGDRQTIEVANFCPMCGARMGEDEDIPMEYFENGGI